jgi:hypothetical protein
MMFAAVNVPVIVAGDSGQAGGCGNVSGGTVGGFPHRNTLMPPLV